MERKNLQEKLPNVRIFVPSCDLREAYLGVGGCEDGAGERGACVAVASEVEDEKEDKTMAGRVKAANPTYWMLR